MNISKMAVDFRPEMATLQVVKGRVGDFRDLVESESFGYFNGDSDLTGILRIFKRIFFFRECNAMLINAALQ
jgi:hypothetical protein